MKGRDLRTLALKIVTKQCQEELHAVTFDLKISNLTREHVEGNPGKEVGRAVPPGRDPGSDNVWAEDLHDDVELQGVREEDGKRV